jgi:hypothetical protein
MSNHWLTTLTLSLVCALPIEFTILAQSKEIKAGTATVSGRVTIKGEPAQGITVYLQQQMMELGNTGTIVPSAKTDGNGHFRIAGVRGGRYSANTQAPGFIMPGEKNAGMMFPGKSLLIADGESIEDIEIELVRGSVITGRVTDSNSRPLVEEPVELTKLDNTGNPQRFFPGAPQMMLTTDDRGVYRIFDLPQGRYILSAGNAGSVRAGGGARHQKTYYPDVTDQSQAKVVEVGEGEEVTGIDINVGEAKKTFSISGRVINAENGQPVAGVSITIGYMSPEGGRITRWGNTGGRSNLKGEFQLMATPGKYSLSVGGNFGYGEVVNFYSDPIIVDVGESEINGIEIKARNAGSIDGLVVIEGTNDPALSGKLSQLFLYITSMGNKPGERIPTNNRARVDASGRFSAQGLPPGKISIQLMTSTELQGLSLIRIERDGVAQPKEGIEIGPGEHVSNLRLVTTIGTLSLRGELRIVGGTLPPNSIIFITASRVDTSTRNSRGGQLDARNHFLIENLSPGEYELRAMVNFQSQNIDQQLRKRISQITQKVVISDNNQQPVIFTIDLSQGGSNQ